MKASELRIGNFLAQGDTCVEVSGVSKENFGVKFTSPTTFISTYTWDTEIVSPIPLTQEWLERLVFEKYQWTDAWFIRTRLGDLMIHFAHNSIHTYFTRVTNDSKGQKMNGRSWGLIDTTQNVRYIHQLQNLYFALTGEELTIKE